MHVKLSLGLGLLLLASVAQADRSFGIGTTTASQNFQTISDFVRDAPCLRAGDRVVLEAGRRHVGSLSLRICPDSGKGIVDVMSSEAGGRSATLMASATAEDLGLRWERANEDVPAGAVVRRGLALYRLGPLPGGVTQVLDDRGPLPASAWPDQGGEPAPRMFISSAMTSTQQGCSAWRCIRSQAEFWPEQLKAIGALPVDQRPSVVLRHSPWSYTRHDIAGIDLKRQELAIAATAGATATAEDKDFGGPGYGFILFGSPTVMNAQDEWWLDRSTRRLYLVADANTRTDSLDRRVRVSLVDERADGAAALTAAPQGQGRSSIKLRIRDLHILHGSGNGVRIERLEEVDLAKTVIEWAADNGIHVSGIHRATITGSTVRGTASNGILALDVQDLRISNNEIRDAGRVGTQQQLTMQFNGVRASRFTRIAIENNEIDGVGYSGILLAERGSFEQVGDVRPELTISGNRIANFCRLLNDCGAIHINGGRRGERVTPSDLRPIAKRIEGNRISDPRPLLAGLPVADSKKGPAADNSGAWRRMVGAVYLDHGSSGYDVRGNTVSGSYTPFGWHVVNGGIENACDRESARLCRAGAVGSRAACYVKAVTDCNDAPPMPKK